MEVNEGFRNFTFVLPIDEIVECGPRFIKQDVQGASIVFMRAESGEACGLNRGGSHIGVKRGRHGDNDILGHEAEQRLRASGEVRENLR